MLYSPKKETQHERLKDKSTNRKNLWDNTHPLSPHPHPDMNQPPHLSHPPIIHSNSTMDTEFLVQMRQSNKYGSGIWCRPRQAVSPASCKTQPHLLIPSVQKINQKKTKNPEMRFNSQQIISYCLDHSQNPGLREVDLESSPKRGSGKINMLK